MYDIFERYKKSLNESFDSTKYNDVTTQDDCCNTVDKEKMFDEAFEHVYGIDNPEADTETLHEAFGAFPDWLKNFILRNKSVKAALTKRGVDLARATYISGEIPRNARDAAFKDPSRFAVFRLRDRPEIDGYRPYEVIYIPGITDPDVYPDINNKWSRFSASSISKKKLIELCIEYGYIDMNDSRNSNLAIRRERAAAKDGMIDREPQKGMYPKRTNVIYGTNPDGSRNWDDIVGYDVKWVTQRGYDKSGYKLDPDKYGRMLDNVGLDDYAVRLRMLYNKIESARTRLISVMTKYTAADSMKVRVKSSWERNIFGNIQRIVSDFSRAIDSYRELEGAVNELVTADDIDDAQKDRRIRNVFQWTGKRVREYLNEVTDGLKNVESAEPI